MTTVLTRLFGDTGTASDAVSALRSEGFADSSLDVISGGGDARQAMIDARVPEAAAAAYSEKMGSSNALLAVRAPFGMAGRAKTALSKFDTVDVDVPENETYVGYKAAEGYHLSIIPGKKRYFTGDDAVGHGPVFTPFGIPLLSKNQRAKARVSTTLVTGSLGMPMLSKYRRKHSVISGNPTPLSSAFGMRLIKKSRPKAKVMRGNRTPFSNALGWPTIAEPDR